MNVYQIEPVKGHIPLKRAFFEGLLPFSSLSQVYKAKSMGRLTGITRVNPVTGKVGRDSFVDIEKFDEYLKLRGLRTISDRLSLTTHAPDSHRKV